MKNFKQGDTNIYQKIKNNIKTIILFICIFLIIDVSVGSSFNITNNQHDYCNTLDQTNIRIIDFGEIKDGNGLTVEVCNIGNVDIEDIQLYVDTRGRKGCDLVILLKNQFQIPFLAAGDSTEVYVPLFGFRPGLFLDYPILTLRISALEIETAWKIITTTILGFRTNIIEEISYFGDPYEGYTLFAPMWGKKTYLINNDGKVMHAWNSAHINSQASYLLENGNLIRTSMVWTSTVFSGGAQGRIEMFNSEGDKIWDFIYSTDQYNQHHDVEPLPNGNILLIAWEVKTKAEAVAAGKNPNNLNSEEFWPDHIIELDPIYPNGDNIVWEWHVFDHLIQDFDPTKDNYGVVSEHPELIDVNYGGKRADWNHINSVDYNEKFDQILLCSREFDEVWIIDHSTTTGEAANHTGGKYGKGGDILYRWGNPQTYQCGEASDKKFFAQHDARWIEGGCPGEGNILVFNNGVGRPNGGYSSVDEIIPPVDEDGFYDYVPGKAYGPEEQIWIYVTPNPSDLNSKMCSSSQRLPNGNTLICSAQKGYFLEVTNENGIVWEYHNYYPLLFIQKSVTEIYRYPLDYPGIPEVINIDAK